MFAPGPTTAARPGESLERALVASVGMLSAVLAMTSGLVLLVRRAGGGFETVSGGGLIAAAVLGGTLVLACDAAAGASGLRSAWRMVARAGYVLALGALALPPRFGAPLDAWAFVAAAVLAGGFVTRPLGSRPAGRWLPSLRIPSSRRLRAEPPSDRQPAAGNSWGGGCPGRVAQRFERYELDGMDCVRGTLVLAVPPGARSAHGHVGFCPSFRQVPVVEVATEYDGVEAVVTAAEVVPWGVRVECRLDEPVEESVEIPVDVVARAPA